jgi:Ca2+-binding RTX toxin-like protein
VNLAAGTGTGGDADGDKLTSIENLKGSGQADTLIGNDLDNFLTGGGGADHLQGGLGGDTYFVFGADSVVTENADAGTDALIAAFEAPGSITVPQNVEILSLVSLLDAKVSAIGTETSDQIQGTGGPVLIKGLGGNDTLVGGDDGDTLIGGTGKDTLDGGKDLDTLRGETGNDVYFVDRSSDKVIELSAQGIDAVKATSSYTPPANVENLTLFGTGNTNGAGNSSNNSILGNGEKNVLSGLGGNDTLNGGAGVDTLRGGLGKDSLFGGTERDIFDFNSPAESKVGASHDVINDFHHGTNVTGDDIDLRDIDAKTGVAGNQAFNFIGTQAFHHLQGELHYQDLGASCLVQGDVNGDATADFEILVKTGSLSAGDFLL